MTTLGDRLAQRFGLELEGWDERPGVVTLEPGPHLVAHGVVRAAVWVLIVDVAGGLAADTQAGTDWVFTTDLSVRVPELVVPRRVVATPRLLRLGRASIAVEVQIADEAGAPFAYGLSTFVRLARREGDNPKPLLHLPQHAPLEAPLVEEAGIRVLDPAQGRVEVDLVDALRNPAGAMQGASVALLGEVAAEERASHEAGVRQIVTDLDVRYLAMGQVGPVHATADPVAPVPGSPLRVELRDRGKDDRVVAVMLARTAPRARLSGSRRSRPAANDHRDQAGGAGLGWRSVVAPIPTADAVAPNPSGVVVAARSVAKRWGATLALRDVDIQIGRGVTGLLGANGAGKTSFLRLVLGQHRVDAGELVVLGHDPWTAGPEVRARIGWSPEHEALPPDVRAQDIVRHLAELHGLPPRAALERASEALNEVGLAEERFRPVGTMSTGQKQRVKLAQAIAHDPDLVLLDEPTNGLDPLQRDAMLGLIRRVSQVFGLDVVVSSHLLGEVERICDSVVLLDGGVVAASGRVAELTRRQGVLVVEVVRDVDDLARALAGAGLTVERRAGEALVVRLATGGRVDDAVYDLVRDAVADLGLELRRLSQRSSTLEDLFLDAADQRSAMTRG